MKPIRPYLTLSTPGLPGITTRGREALPALPTIETANFSGLSTAVKGIDAVRECGKEHGLVASHLPILADFAEDENVVFAFRPVNHLATQLIAQGYPTKDLNIKGKSSDWGPMAGFIPKSQKFSKLFGDADAIEKSDLQVAQCEKDKHAVFTQLVINDERIAELQKSGLIGIRGKVGMGPIEIHCDNGGEHFVFKGELSYENGKANYKISHKGEPLEVLAKPDSVTGTARPLTADYDMFMFAPPIEKYGSQDNYKASESAQGKALQAQFAAFSFGAPAAPGEALSEENRSESNETNPASLPEHPFVRRSSSLGSIHNRGVISDRLDQSIPSMNKALGRPAPEDAVIHHGPDTHNPYTNMDDNLPCTFFLPKRLGGVVMVRTKDEMAALMREIKQAGFQFFGNREWAGELPASNYRRPSYDTALAELDGEQGKFFRSRSASRRGSYQGSGSPHLSSAAMSRSASYDGQASNPQTPAEEPLQSSTRRSSGDIGPSLRDRRSSPNLSILEARRNSPQLNILQARWNSPQWSASQAGSSSTGFLGETDWPPQFLGGMERTDSPGPLGASLSRRTSRENTELSPQVDGEADVKPSPIDGRRSSVGNLLGIPEEVAPEIRTVD